MIQYSKYKRFYSVGEFTLSGSDYNGYVEVIDGIPCEDITRKLLSSKQTFSTEFRLSKFFLDRLISDTPTLPNNENNILIETNDYLNTSLLSEKLNKLHENNLFLYTRLFISDNNIPNPSNVSYIAPREANDTELSLFNNFNSSVSFKQSANFKQIGDIKRFVTRPIENKENHYALFGISDTQFITLTTNKTETTVLETVQSASRYETTDNELIFKDLGDITSNDTHVFISDTGNNVILKYEVRGYYNNDLALANKRNFIEVIGGEGKSNDNTRFNKPSLIACTNSNVVVYDSENGALKVFDTNFNYVTHLKGVAYTRERVVSMKFNTQTNLLYCLTQTTDRLLRLYIYDSVFNLLDTQFLEEILEENENVNNITFSYNDSNLWYICTTAYVYKKLVNRPEKLVGRFQTENIFSNLRNTQIIDDETPVNNIWNYTNINWQDANFPWNTLETLILGNDFDAYEDGITIDKFKGIYTNVSSQNNDDIILLSDCRLYFIREQSVYRSILKFDNFDNYGTGSFNIKNDEFIQGSTLNKELYKIVYDLFLLKNNIVGRFCGFYDGNIPTLTKSGYNYNIDFLNITSQEFIDDFLTKYNFNLLSVSENEKSILGVINRVLAEVYNLQRDVYKITQTDFEIDVIPVFNIEGTLVIE